MFLQSKYLRATEGWDLEQQVNEFLAKLSRDALIDVKFSEQQTSLEPPNKFVSALIIFEG